MTEDIKVGDLVISRTKTLWSVPVGRPALVIAAAVDSPLGLDFEARYIRLKVGSREWWDKPEDCEKVPE